MATPLAKPPFENLYGSISPQASRFMRWAAFHAWRARRSHDPLITGQAPGSARCQFGQRPFAVPGPGAKLVELRADGAILKPPLDKREVFSGDHERDDGLVVCVLARAGKVARVVQYLPALPV